MIRKIIHILLYVFISLGAFAQQDSLGRFIEERRAQRSEASEKSSLRGLNSGAKPAGSIAINRDPAYKDMSPTELVEKVLARSGVAISNVNARVMGWNRNQGRWVGGTDGFESRGLGYFHSADSNFPIPEGIVMTTGADVRRVEGPNLLEDDLRTQDDDIPSFNIGSDADLATIATSNIASVGVLEFDFVPTGRVMEFKYVWSSEEYPRFVGASFNDVFGFFVTKVGTSNPAENIALLPDRSVVSIDNVNSGQCQNFDYTGPTGVAKNEQYFIKNGVNQPTSLATSVNGYTTVLTARYEGLEPCDTYHLKLVLGTVGDEEYGSAVFIQAHSLTTGTDLVLHSNGAEDANGIFKNCNNNTFIRLINKELSATTVNLEYSSGDGLVNGTHYTTDGTTALPLSVTIPANSSYDIPVRAASSVTNGAYFDVRVLPSCSFLSTTPKRVYIYDNPSMTTSIVRPCSGSSNNGSITVMATGGTGDYEYSLGGIVWQNGNTFNNLGTGAYSIGVRNRGSCATITPANLTVSTFSADAGPDMTTETLSGTTDRKSTRLNSSH